ncbi:MAG: DNA-protecting protein DprA [Sphingobacteriales bacterium]|nr:MAG: DNA-protecting protein DprA [Sphingobacteriales bacterium]
MDKEKLYYLLALLMVPKIGSKIAKQLIAYCGSPENVFKQKKGQLSKIPGIGATLSQNLSSFSAFARAEEEIKFIEKHNIQPLYFLDEAYPQRLRDLHDAPILLFYKGKAMLNYNRIIGIVGTRKATDYGRAFTEKLVEELAQYKVQVVSGLAYGIDYLAHKAALKNGLETIGVMGTGLDTIYPSAHRNLAAQMVENGGLLTEYISGSKPDREHFPARNRIVAGMTDALVLVETTRTGGALITAEIAHSYNREVFAVAGRQTDEFSAGCNYFIKINKAYLLENAADIAFQLGWDLTGHKPDKSESYKGLSNTEMEIIEVLKEKERVDFDTILHRSRLNASKLSMILLELEFKGLVQALPAKFFRLK